MICLEDLASVAICRECEHPFWIDYCAEGRRRIYCSLACNRRAAKRAYDRSEPGRAARSRQAHVRRMRERGGAVERFTPMEIFNRDKWICGVCRKRVPKVSYPDPRSPSLDHVIPLSEDGDHTRANVRLTHWICNSRRGTSGIDQLRLLG